MSIEAMKQALDCLQTAYNLQQIDDLIPPHAPVKQAVAALRQAIEQAEKQEPVALEIIRKWPEGFQERLQHVWLDVVSFIPNVKLYDLQRVLAEFGFTMKLYEGEAPTAQQQEIDWKDQYEKQKRRSDMWQAKYEKDIGPIEKAGPVTARREWVGITTEEMEKSKPPLSNDAIVWELAVEWAEAKLKEKNT